MIFEINHTTAYSYSRPVFLEPHLFRLRPRCDAAHHLLRFDFDIQPAPAGVTQSLEVDGHLTLRAWFLDVTESLSIKTRSRIVAQQRNPFDYILADDAAALLPMSYTEPLKNLLAPYSVPYSGHPVVERFANSIAERNEWKTLEFLTALNREIYRGCRQVVREQGGPLSPEDTLLRKEGTCRDLAVLFIDACRHLSIAARFVSGYLLDDTAGAPRDLHAWAEVYLAGAGWRGYDPSQGLAVEDRHVALAAAAVPRLAAPVTGAFRGNGVQSTLSATIEIRVVDESSDASMRQTMQPC